MTTTARLLELAAAYEDKARSLRLAAAELNGHLTTKATGALPSRLAQATALRAAQRSTVATGPRARQMSARREALRDLLQPDGQYRIVDIQGDLRAAGYTADLATLRTDLHALEWAITGKAQHSRWTKSASAATNGTTPKATKKATKAKPSGKFSKRIHQQRVLTAKVLAKVADASEPVAASVFKRSTPVGVLVRYGYIKAEGGGYVRTEKAFTV